MSKRTPTTPATTPATHTRTTRRPRLWRAYVAMTWASLLSQLRSVANFFFGFIFPLAFIAVFGLIGNSNTVIRLGVTTGSDQTSPIYQALSHISAVKLSTGSSADLEQQLKQGNLDGVLTIVDDVSQSASSAGASTGYAVTLDTSSASPQTASAASALVRGVVDEVNLRAAGIVSPAVSLTTRDVAGRVFNFIDFELPGLLGFSLLSIAVFGTAFGFVVLKRTLVLKRIFATPTRPSMIVLGQGTSRLIIAFAQVLVLLMAGVWLFHFHLAHGITTLAEMLVVALFGLVAFLGFGLVIAGNFKDENAMGPVVNLVTLPQFLLAGTFFPTESFPAWLQPVANNLPLSFLNVALRNIASQGASLYDVRWQLLGILVWGVVTYAVAVFTFKWE